MLRPHARNSGENDTTNVKLTSKTDRNVNAKAALLRDKDVNRGLENGSPRSKDKESFQKLFTRTNSNNENYGEDVFASTPTKRAADVYVSTPTPKRMSRTMEIEYAPPREEELPWQPDFELDFSAFGDRVETEAFGFDDEEDYVEEKRPHFELESIEEEAVEELSAVTHLKEESATTTVATSIPSRLSVNEEALVIQHPSSIEYGPTAEHEQAETWAPETCVDIGMFSSVPDVSAYEFAGELDDVFPFSELDDEDIFALAAVLPIDDDALEFDLRFLFDGLLEKDDVHSLHGIENHTLDIPFSDFLFDLNVPITV